MKTMKLGIVLLALLLAGMAMVPMVSADAVAGESRGSTVITPVPTVNASDLTRFCGGNTCPMPERITSPVGKKEATERLKSQPQLVETIWISDNLTKSLIEWNEKLKWGYTEQQISSKVQALDNPVLSKYREPTSQGYLTIQNRTQFYLEIGDGLGLSKEQSVAFAKAIEENLATTRLQNFEKSFSSNSISQTIKSAKSVSPTTQSAPYAYGTTYMVYIVTEFTTASPNPYNTGYWNSSEIDTALQRGDTAFYDIVSQSPSQSNMEYASVMYRTTINGQNLGDNVSAYGSNGWMETAAYNLGYRDDNADGRQSDELARFIKTVFSADSVTLIYLTHDARGGWATGPDSGYADKATVSYWELWQSGNFVHYPAEVYEHEGLHTFGALDEYINGSYCNAYSGLAVSPMSELYTNTNHESCPGTTVNSIMRNPFPLSGGTSVISQSSKNFIGWGDHDTDGIIDPLDSTP